jgi:glutathione S-transferase
MAPLMTLASSPWSVVLDDEHAPPPSTPERQEYLSWLFFAVTKLQPSVLEAFLVRDDADAFAHARAAFEAYARVVEDALAARSHLVGALRTAADVKVATVLVWAASMGLLDASPRLREYAKRVCP